MRTRVMSELLRGASGQMDAEQVGMAFGRRSLLAEPEVEHIESAGSQGHSSDPSVLLGGHQLGILEHPQVLQSGPGLGGPKR